MILTKNNSSFLTPIIDCRSFAEYSAGHIKGATSLPATDFFTRMHEMPQRHTPLHICGSEDDLALARKWLLDRDFFIQTETIWSDQLRFQIAIEGKLETGNTSLQLWKPSPLLRFFIEMILPDQPFSSKNGLDIACGSGRDMVYLAMNNWNMTGVDYSLESLERCQNLSRNHHVSINTFQVDLEKNSSSFNPLDNLTNHFDLVTVFRYLHRPLFPELKRLIKPGGYIIYQTFMEGCEQIGSPRNPRFLLKHNELAATFYDFTIIKDDINYLYDKRPVSAFIARKPG